MLEPVYSSGKSLTLEIADRIRDHIIQSGLKPGDKLPNETELCGLLGVGRGTIREAMKTLSSQNIITIERGRGTFVSKNPGQVDDPFGLYFLEDKKQVVFELLQLRSMIEPDLVRLAAENASPEEIMELENLEHELEDCYHKNLDHVQTDVAFHRAIARCSHNRVVEIIFPVLTRTIPALSLFTNGISFEETINDHRQIIQAIKARNADFAEKYVIRHIQRNIDFIKELGKSNIIL